MRVIHIFSINSGGAAIAAKRIAESVELYSNYGVKNSYLTLYSTENSNDVKMFYSNSVAMSFVKVGRKLSEILFEPKIKNYPGPFTMGEFGVANRVRLSEILQEIDVIHIHWINRGFFSIRQLKQLADFNIPIVWTMHDMWAFTGGCHYDGECGNYREKCTNCICVIKGKKDFWKEQLEKKKIFEQSNFYFVGCSEWITNCARESYILKEQKHVMCIPNPIDSAFISSSHKNICGTRNKYKVPNDKKIVLFGAMSLKDERKGGNLIADLISKMPSDEFHIVIFGDSSGEIEELFDNITSLGKISNSEIMNEIYSMCDAFIALSIQENLANTVMESLASGTPVVAFNIGGMPDMIIDGINGKLVDPFNISDFIASINYVVERPWMRQKAVETVKNRFSSEIIGKKYYSLYFKTIENKESKI